MDSDRGRIDKYIILRTLGKGSTATVKLASNIETGEKVALKLINPDKLSSMRIELNALQLVPEHPNIVKLIGFSNSSWYFRTEGRTRLVSYIALELGKNGEIFDYVQKLGGFPESIARRYTKELISAVEALHNSGIVHRDLKPENIFFSENFELKLADFGFTAPIKGRNGMGLLGTYKGTRPYMAPEILEKKRYRGALTDIFSCGIIIFIIVVGRPPFFRAERQNPHFQHIVNGNWERFWNFHKSAPNTPDFSTEFRDLIEHMLAYNPDERFSIDQIKNHSWIIKESASLEEAQRFLSAGSDISERNESFVEGSRIQVEVNRKKSEDCVL
ncbi:unnamed protein product [Blepharisma stoltei]|uniref:non-specific serine/threonine protein kinase n=1 Tax=Blepharisma stoltei TaxID=1481888 RepID=A0AAU9K642_9CILI|nr:unnamed protein product [Blepharisma stoltei]